MSLNFNNDGFENLFREALNGDINLFCGAGFSVEAKNSTGEKLLIGSELLDEIKKFFPIVKEYTSLPRACTRVKSEKKRQFNSYLTKIFTVESFNPLYNDLIKLNIKHIYTTNIDDLFYQIYEKSEEACYLNDRSTRGQSYQDENAVHYFPLHGTVRIPEKEYVFGATEISSAFSTEGNEQSWSNLARDASENTILFWGWNFEDSGPLEAMYGKSGHIDNNIKRWVLLYEPKEETIDFLRSLKFNIIIGSTLDMLQYISEYTKSEEFKKSIPCVALDDKMRRFCIPKNDDQLPSYPLVDYFNKYLPMWSHIYSGEISKTSWYKRIANLIASGNNVFVTGMRCSGKTTLMMQLLAYYQTNKHKYYLVSPSVEQAKVFLSLVTGIPSIIFIDDCFRDTDAMKLILMSPVQAICFDRDFNFERQRFKINDCRFEQVDISEITGEDVQSIIESIPHNTRHNNPSYKNIERDPTILTVLASSLRSTDFHFISNFYRKDKEAARVFLMIAYVNSCGVPCSFDMIYSFLGDEEYSWEEMREIVERAGKLICDVSDGSGYDIKEGIQNYYSCRSRFLAEKIIEGIHEKESEMLAEVIRSFALKVPPFKICMYDKFKRSAYDADIASRAFPEIKEGIRFYEICAEKDESEYIYQQAALYFSRKNEYKIAFSWIEKARNLSHYNHFSIDSTYARIFFDSNLGIEQTQCKKALDTLQECCRNDRRRSIHFSAYATRCREYYRKWPSIESKKYITDALSIIDEGLQDQTLALSYKNKRELKELRTSLQKI